MARTARSVAKPASKFPPATAGTFTWNVPSGPSGTALPSWSSTADGLTETLYVPLAKADSRPPGAGNRYVAASVGCTPGGVAGRTYTAVVVNPPGPLIVRS